jgi:alkanesulfonate monooxygenase SsuD/methylene tetrahydromethanopterin reductase-like flavin-dependent oxidoreductase (luciferase family)
MDFALQVSGLYEDVLEAAQFAEARGLVALALPDHYLMAQSDEAAATTPAPDALAQLAGLARDTRSIELVVLVAPITYRHPAVLAKTAITIDRMSGGRFTLGVGTGWLEREHEVFGFEFPGMAERFARFEEALGYIRAILADEPTGFTGDHYRLERLGITPRPVGTVKLLVGGVGKRKTPRLAGTYADEFNVYLGPDLEGRIALAREAAVAAGRDPDAVLMSSAGQILTARDAADLDERIDEMASRRGLTREQVHKMADRGNALIGTYDQLAERFAAIARAGVERFYLQGIFDAANTAGLLDSAGV